MFVHASFSNVSSSNPSIACASLLLFPRLLCHVPIHRRPTSQSASSHSPLPSLFSSFLSPFPLAFPPPSLSLLLNSGLIREIPFWSMEAPHGSKEATAQNESTCVLLVFVCEHMNAAPGVKGLCTVSAQQTDSVCVLTHLHSWQTLYADTTSLSSIRVTHDPYACSCCSVWCWLWLETCAASDLWLRLIAIMLLELHVAIKTQSTASSFYRNSDKGIFHTSTNTFCFK